MERININNDYVVFSEEDKKSVLDCMNNSETSIFIGDTVSRFENDLSKYLNVNYSLAVPNCTLALYTTFQSLGINPGDEVIVPNLTHASSIYPIIMSGAKLKVCDFEKNSYNYDLNMLKELITDKTKYMLVCYLYGMSLNIEEIADICKKNNIILIEDCAQAFGTKINNKYTGTFGNAGCYSFNDTKMLRLGEGGAIVTNDQNLKIRIENFRHVSEVFNSTKRSSVSNTSTYGDLLFNGLSNDGRGLNVRPSPILFSFGINRLNNIDETIKKRQEKHRIYYELLKDIEGVKLIENFDINNSQDYAPIAYWLVLDNNIYDRNRLMIGLLNMGVPIGSFNYNCINKNDYFKNFIVNNDECINSNYVRNNSIFLPLYENITREDVIKICLAFKYVIEEYKNNSILFDENIYNEQIDYFDGFYLMRSKK